MQKRIGYMMVGGLLALTLAFGGMAAFAQTDDGEAEPTETPTQEDNTAVETTPVVPDGFRGGHGRPGFGAKGDNQEALAAALGITVAELEAAHTAARTALIAQAVADGELTQAQADELLQNGSGGRGGFRVGSQSEALAEALGITVEELQAAQAQVQADELAALVEAGTITQEQADLMLARQAVRDYVDQDALQTAVQSVYETAVAAALAAGDITQEQADALLRNLSEGLGGFGGPGFGGHGHHR
ncbi:MAG: hypothetical protein KJ069_11485 [Anaerolineae bacterium]|nr:hypothetical protein [Anaerolineae bacterium]